MLALAFAQNVLALEVDLHVAQPASITVAAEATYPPYSFRNNKGQLEGLVPDVWKKWEEKTGIKVNLVTPQWAESQQMLFDGQVDAIEAIFMTPAREQRMSFSSPYALVETNIFVHKDLGGITDAGKLNGFLIGVVEGDACIELLAKHNATNLAFFRTEEELVESAKLGAVKVFCSDAPPANHYLYKFGADREYKKAFTLFTGKLHWAVRKDDERMLHVVRVGMSRISAAEWHAIRSKWLGNQSDKNNASAEFLLYALAITVVIGGALGFWTVTLRKEVKRQTKELTERQALFETLINNSPDLVWMKDPKGIYQIANPRVNDLLGATEGLVTGKTDLDLEALEWADQELDQDCHVLAQNAPMTTEATVVFASDGHKEVLEITKIPVFDQEGRATGIIGVGRNITERQRRRDQLLKLNRLYRLLLSVGEAISRNRTAEGLLKDICQISVDAGEAKLAWFGRPNDNKELAPVVAYGYNADALVQLRFSLEAKDGATSMSAAAFLSGITDVSDNFFEDSRLVRFHDDLAIFQVSSGISLPIMVDDRVKWIFSLYSENLSYYGKPETELLERMALNIGFALEAIENKRELDLYQVHLEELVKQRTVDLDILRQEAEQLAKAKTVFLANMSHEIRTPLNGVMGFAWVGYQRNQGRKSAQDTFAKIIDSSKLLLGIIDDILDFSKIDAGMLRIESADTDLNRVIGEAVRLVRDKAKTKGVGFRTEKLNSIPAWSKIDGLRLQQVLINLLSNAVKFTEEGSVTLKVGFENDWLHFAVEDTGIGMSQDQVDRVFAPFVQADASITKRFGGTGLGLSITEKLVSLMGGRIEASSREGEGSCFKVWIPHVPSEGLVDQAIDAESIINAIPVEGLAVMVVDDNEDNLIVAEEILGSAGAIVLTASSGAQCLELLSGNSGDGIHVVLTDIQMPRMDGYELCKQIKKEYPRLPVIGITADVLAESSAKWADAGMEGCIEKPLAPELLIRCIRRAVSKKKLNAA